jgi:hypothetical protein
MATRTYTFTTGIETSDAPTGAAPSATGDIMTLGYADTTYARRRDWGFTAADYTALKAIGTTGDNQRYDGQTRLVTGTGEIWRFDSASSSTEDGSTILAPTSGTGRWLIVSGGGSGSSGTASNLESLETSNELFSQGYYSNKLDDSLRTSGLDVPAHSYVTGNLIENYTSGDVSGNIVWNPIVIYDSDKDYDSTTNWAAVGAGTTLSASAGSNKVGSNKFTFNKDGSAVDASIRHTLAAQTLNVAGNYRVYFWLNIPSTTNLSSVFLKIMGAATTDFSRWNLTTSYSGASLTTGWQLFFVDIKNTTASSTGGTAWTTTQLARYVEVGVTTSSAGQTYTAIAFDGLWFSLGDIESWGPKYLEFTIADTSNKNDLIIDSSNSRQDGYVKLGSTIAQNYTAGLSSASAAKVLRSTLSWSQSGLIGFNSAMSSGTVNTEQELRLTRILRESSSSNYAAYVDMYTPQLYRVAGVSGSSIGVEDSENTSGNCLSGNEFHIFKTYNSGGEKDFSHLATRTITANSSATGGITTLTLDPTNISVGDYVAKQHLTTSLSVVSTTANENFTNLSYDTSPNGAQLIGSRSYPYPSFVYSHNWLGAASESIALRDQSGNNRGMSKIGSPNLADTFKAGKFSYSTGATTDYVRLPAGSASALNATSSSSLVQFSIWVYYNGTSGSDREIFNAWSYHGATDYRGWKVFIVASDNKFSFPVHNSSATASSNVSSAVLTSGTWNHLFCQVKGSSVHTMYLNGVLNSTTAGAIAGSIPTAQASYVGVRSDSTSIDSTLSSVGSGLKFADLIVWNGAPQMGQAEVNYLYNAGNPQFFGYNPALLRNEYVATAQSGQKISMKSKLNRSTSGVNPYILRAGVIKT